jgi:hypothetical protein
MSLRLGQNAHSQSKVLRGGSTESKVHDRLDVAGCGIYEEYDELSKKKVQRSHTPATERDID